MSDSEQDIQTLNDKQRIVFDKVIKALNDKNVQKCLYIDGPRGSEKKLLIKYLKGNVIDVLPVAWTGIVASLLEGGKTSHSTFKLLLNITENTTCNIIPNSEEDMKLSKTRVIIWDEISMASKYAFKALDRLLKDLYMNTRLVYLVSIVSGDFRQILPIIRHGNRVQIIENTVKRSRLLLDFY